MIILGLGSNIENRLKFLNEAVKMLGEDVMTAMELSPIYESSAILKPGSSEEWDKPYLNMVIIGETHLTPQALLTNVKCVERRVGRKPRGTWEPREIDIDILAYGDQTIESNELQIPHKELCSRPFVMVPLADIAPNWRYPGNGECKGKTAYEMSLMADMTKLKKTAYTIDLATVQFA